MGILQRLFYFYCLLIVYANASNINMGRVYCKHKIHRYIRIRHSISFLILLTGMFSVAIILHCVKPLLKIHVQDKTL